MEIGLFVILLLGCLTLTFGSWFETNSVLHQQFTIYNIELYNKTSQQPFVHLSFGLWSSCAWNATWSICSSVKMNNNLDVNQALQLTKKFNSSFVQPSVSSEASSWIRFIPLLLASCISVLTAAISLYLLPKNTKKLVQRRALLWMTSALCLVNVVLVSLAYATTLQSYTYSLSLFCHSLSSYECRRSFQAEVILLGISLGLFTLGSLYPIFDCCRRSRLSKLEGSRVSIYAQSGLPRAQSSGASFFTEKNQSQTLASSLEPAQEIYLEGRPERLSLRPPPPPLLARTQSPLEPPNPSFAQSDRPLSHGSDNTFGAFQKSSSLLDESDLSSITDPKASSHQTLPYSANNSNHTLGTFNLHPVSVDYSSDDPDETLHQSIHKRINDYLKNSHTSTTSV